MATRFGGCVPRRTRRWALFRAEHAMTALPSAQPLAWLSAAACRLSSQGILSLSVSAWPWRILAAQQKLGVRQRVAWLD